MGSTLLRCASGAGKQAALGLVVLIALLATPAASAAPGDLDQSFGAGGKVVTDFGGTYGGASAVAVQPDGKIVVAGSTGDVYEDRSFAVARYNPDGSLDESFGGDGMQTTDVGGGFDSGAWGVAVQPDGKIVVVGLGGGVGLEHALVVRYSQDGALDSTFSDDGQVALPFHIAQDVVLQPDGGIVVGGGVVSTSAPHNQYGFARLTESGDFDPTFSEDGIQAIAIHGFLDSVHALALQPDGKIVAGGETNSDWGLLRLNQDGELDSTFAGDGKRTTDFGGEYLNGGDILTDLVVQSGGGIVAVGWREGASLFARYTADGTLDAGFPQTTARSELSLNALALQASGKIVTAGASLDGLVVGRYGTDGLLDSGFGGGTIGVPGSGSSDVAIQADGAIVVAGGLADAEFGLVRLDGSDVPPSPPPPDNPTPLPAPPTTPPAPPTVPKPTKPVVARPTNVRLTDKTITTRQRATLRFRLSSPTRVTIKILKVKGGVRRGKRCVPRTAKVVGKRCDLGVVSLKRSLESGAHRVTLPRLKAGWYRVLLTTPNGAAKSPPLPVSVSQSLVDRLK